MKIGWILLLMMLTIPRTTALPPHRAVRLAPAPGPLDNPLKGWCPYTVALAIGIRDPWTGRPAIVFANALSRCQGWTRLCDVTVLPKSRKESAGAAVNSLQGADSSR